VRSGRIAVAAVAVVAAGVLTASIATSGATTSGNGTSSSVAAQAGTVSSIAPTIKVCPLSLLNILGTCTTGVLGTVNTLLGSLLTPVSNLVSDIQAIPSGVVTALVTNGLSASQPSTQLTRPNPEYDSNATPRFPTCGQAGWDSSGGGDCYTGLPVTIPTTALVGVNVTGVTGYATDDGTGYVGAAEAAGVKLSLLGGSLGTIGTVWSHAQCSNNASAPNCAATNSTLNGTFLPSAAYPSGALNVKIANSGAPQVVSINGGALSGINNTVAVPGVGTVAVAISNQLLTLTITLSTSQLTSLLPTTAGLSSLVSDSGTVTIAIGPGTTSTTSGATASGLTISADVSLALKLSVLGLATVNITTGSGITNPDLVNLSVAYSTATAGSPAASWIPAGQI
jgi:hypothetical protein